MAKAFIKSFMQPIRPLGAKRTTRKVIYFITAGLVEIANFPNTAKRDGKSCQKHIFSLIAFVFGQQKKRLTVEYACFWLANITHRPSDLHRQQLQKSLWIERKQEKQTGVFIDWYSTFIRTLW